MLSLHLASCLQYHMKQQDFLISLLLYLQNIFVIATLFLLIKTGRET